MPVVSPTVAPRLGGFKRSQIGSFLEGKADNPWRNPRG
jgi:hypothetical protein